MAEDPTGEPIVLMLHELVEGLQATGNYLSALQRGLSQADGTPPDLEIVERAISQLSRARHAAREIRSVLKDGDVR